MRHLAGGDGPAFLALYAPSLEQAAGRLSAAGVGHRRRGGLVTLPDSTLAYIFLGRRNRSPTDQPEHFDHSNGAQSLVSVWLAGDDLSAADVPCPSPVRTARGSSMFLPPEITHGLWLEFRERR